MRITHIAAGAGGMYCGACNRDVSLARGLAALGHDIELVPLYTPLRDATPGASDAPSGRRRVGRAGGAGLPRTAPVFYGGISVFLQQASALFRRGPRIVDRVLDSPSLLKAVSRFAIEVRAERLGPMTVSVLAGRDGRQAGELDKLLDYLQERGRPDVVSITNTLLSGIAPEVKRRLGCPVVCSLQGEDSFVNGLPAPYRSRALDLMRRNVQAVDRLVAPSEGCAAQMADLLGVPRHRVGIARAGIEAQAFHAQGPRPRDSFAIGYLSVVIPGKGLDLLVEAFRTLALDRGRDVFLRVAGKALNARYWKAVRSRVTEGGLSARFRYLGEVGRSDKAAFLHACSVFSVPSRIHETRGMAVLEVMAAGVPVVAPDSGVFPEMLSLTGGGLLAPPGDPVALADAIERILDDPNAADRMGRQSAEGVRRHYSAAGMAQAMLEEYASAAMQHA